MPDTDYYAATLQNLRLLCGATFEGNMYEDRSSLFDNLVASARALRIEDVDRSRIEADRHEVSGIETWTQFCSTVLDKFLPKDDKTPPMEKWDIQQLVRAVWPNSGFSQLRQIVVALERVQLHTEIVRVPWEPRVDQSVVDQIIAETPPPVVDDVDEEEAQAQMTAWLTSSQQLGDAMRGTIVSGLPDSWGNEEPVCYFHGIDLYALLKFVRWD